MTHCDGSTQPFIAAGNHHVLLQRHTLSLQKSSLWDAKCSSAKFSASVVHQSCKDLLRYLNIYPAFKYLPNIESVSQHTMPSPLGMHSHVGGHGPESCTAGPCCLPSRPEVGWGMGGGPGRPPGTLSFFPIRSSLPFSTHCLPQACLQLSPRAGLPSLPPKPSTEDLCSHTTLLEHP